VRTLLLLAFLAVFAAVAWVAVRGAQARTHLEDAVDGVSRLESRMARFEIDAARQTVAGIQDDTQQAHDLTSDPVWDLLALFPWGGQNLRAVGTATSSVNALAHEGLPALVEAGQGVVTFRERLAAGSLDAAPIEQIAEQVAVFDESLDKTQADVESIDRSYLVPAVDHALDDLAASLDVTGSVGAQLDSQLQQSVGG
jgi:hypothetical protein